MEKLPNAVVRDLKARAQRLEPTMRVGKDGLSPRFIAALDEVLGHKELVKVKFDYFKEEKKELAPSMAAQTHSHLIMRVGNVVVLYRAKPRPEDSGD
jgi:RNA-binding protein